MPSEQHDLRRDEILMTARGLFFSKGYDNTSIADIINAVGIAKGTFYHYFTSKDRLLQALLEQMSQDILASLAPIMNDTSMSAAEKLSRYFRQAMVVKAQSRDLLVPALQVMYAPENTLLRIGLLETMLDAVSPMMQRVVREGVDNGEFTVDDPEMCGDYLMRSFSVISDRAGRMMLDHLDDSDLLPRLYRLFDFMEWTIARLLAVPTGTITITDREAIDTLFGNLGGEAADTHASAQGVSQ